MYDLVVVTHLPAFYKVNLYNEIAKKNKIFVVFLASDTVSKRSNDFTALRDVDFDYELIFEGEFEKRKKLRSLVKLRAILNKISYRNVLISGWDLVEFWYIAFSETREKLSLALESTVYESRVSGIRSWIKKLFLSRISIVYASGGLQEELLRRLRFKRKTVITKGVGIIRKPELKQSMPGCLKNRIVYLGRLSREKNLGSVIKTINQFPWLTLDIYGAGNIEEELKAIAKENVIFHGPVPNSQLQEIFFNADYLILPSEHEPWGLVVEEALYFNLPVIVSDRCGVSEIVKDGFVLSFENFETQLYDFFVNYHRNSVVPSNGNVLIREKDKEQVNAY